MLRECARVLTPNGRLGLYTIHVTPDLSPHQLEEAIALGPTSVGTEGRPWGLCAEAGLRLLGHEDVTEEFERTARGISEARAEVEEALRREEGDEAYEADLAKKERLMRGVAAGLLRRSYVLAEKPDLSA